MAKEGSGSQVRRRGGAKPGERRGGRKKGTPNKITAALKDMVLQALDSAGGVAYLKGQAKKNPNAFLSLLGRVMPLQLTGGEGAAVEIRVKTF